MPVSVLTQTPGEAHREAAWAQLGDDLSSPTKSLGTDALTVLAREGRVNLLLFLSHTETYDYGARTPRAAVKWEQASETERQQQLQSTGKKRAGGRWLEQWTAITQHLVPCFVVQQDWPFIVVYQRTLTEWTCRMKDGQTVLHFSGGTRHFEAVVKRLGPAGVGEYTGIFRPGDHTANEYDQSLTLATRLMAVVNSQAAPLLTCPHVYSMSSHDNRKGHGCRGMISVWLHHRGWQSITMPVRGSHNGIPTTGRDGSTCTRQEPTQRRYAEQPTWSGGWYIQVKERKR